MSEHSADSVKIGSTWLRLTQGDITAQQVDAIVNAANSSLLGGGGVDGAIHRRGGAAILRECRALRESRYPQGLPAGEAALTTAGDLPARRVVHTVGPVWRGGAQGEAHLLGNAYRSSLAQARSEQLRTIAFPSVSTGAYHYPIEQAARVALSTVREEIRGHPDAFDEVRFVLFSSADLRCYRVALAEMKDT